jgi:hypothetical protein
MKFTTLNRTSLTVAQKDETLLVKAPCERLRFFNDF